MLLRSFVLNPFLQEWNARTPGFAEGFADFLYRVAAEAYPEHALRRAVAALGRRLRVCVVEETPEAPDALAHRLQHTPAYAAYLDVRALRPNEAPDALCDRLVVVAPAEAARHGEDALVHRPDGDLSALVDQLCEGLGAQAA